MNNKEFIDFLFRREGFHCLPQIIIKNNYNCAWFPGNQNKEYFLPELVGFTGRSYFQYDVPQNEQPFYIFWAAIDVDDYNDAEKIHSLIPKATIRESKSKKGLHLFFRFEEPVFCEKGTKGSIVKASLKPFIKILEENGLGKYICKWDGNPFFLISSVEQKVLYLSLDFISFVEEEKFCEKVQKLEIKDIFSNLDQIDINLGLNGCGNALVHILKKNGLISSFNDILEGKNIYVKEWFFTLKNTPFEFRTKSPMKSDKKHVNGKVFIEDKFFCIYCSCDNFVVKKFKIID